MSGNGGNMKIMMPKKYFYIDDFQINSFYEQVYGKLLKELSNSKGKNTKGEIGLSFKLASIIKALFPVDPSIESKIEHSRDSNAEEKNVISPIGLLDRMIELFENKKVEFYFTDIDKAVEYCESENTAIINATLEFDIIQFHLPNKDPIEEINRDKAILFQYGTIAKYDESDDYFKKAGKRITMMASLSKMPSSHDYFGATCHEAVYFRGFGGRNVRIKVFGQIIKAYEYYQIKPFVLSY